MDPLNISHDLTEEKKKYSMMPFFNRTGLERIGVVGPEIGLLLGWSIGSGCGATDLQSLNMALLYKDKKKKGSAGASLVPALMPKSVSF